MPPKRMVWVAVIGPTPQMQEAPAGCAREPPGRIHPRMDDQELPARGVVQAKVQGQAPKKIPGRRRKTHRGNLFGVGQHPGIVIAEDRTGRTGRDNLPNSYGIGSFGEEVPDQDHVTIPRKGQQLRQLCRTTVNIPYDEGISLGFGERGVHHDLSKCGTAQGLHRIHLQRALAECPQCLDDGQGGAKGGDTRHRKP